ncbi:MAG: helix-turn-helix transcriptional regulator [Actinomycetales bacterium]|jgi:DNA-binding IclR family transcriptional regulator
MSDSGNRTWTFLTNHGHVLVCLHRDPHLRIRDIADEVGITDRAVQAILLDLEQGGYLTKEKVGRRNEYRVNPDLAFRHPAEAMRPIGELLRIFDQDAALRTDSPVDRHSA